MTPNAQMSARLSTGRPPRLFRAHVRGGAEHHPHFGRRRRHRDGRHRVAPPAAAGHGHSLRQAEIEHLHRAVVQTLILAGFEIAVDDALFVGGVQRLGDLSGDRQGVGPPDWAAPMSGERSSPSTSSMTSAVRLAVFFGAVDGRDVRVVQRRERPGLAQRIGRRARMGERTSRVHLDRDVTFSLVSRARETWPIPPSPMAALTS